MQQNLNLHLNFTCCQAKHILFCLVYQRISQRTAELQDNAENFASMAHELAKQMEKRKWWNI